MAMLRYYGLKINSKRLNLMVFMGKDCLINNASRVQKVILLNTPFISCIQ